MIIGIGTDVIEVQRIQKLLEKDSYFKGKIFTVTEVNYCESRKNKAEHFAARFSAKEALFKALGTGWRGEMSFNEIEVVNDSLGKPDLVLHGKVKEAVYALGVNKIHLSLSHLKSVAMAFVILEKL